MCLERRYFSNMIIYKTTNLINNRFYVGQDANNDNEYLGSGLLLKQAIQKYGKQNFKKETLEYCNSKDELEEAERYWIKILNAQERGKGYNITGGGYGMLGYKASEETKRLIGFSSTLPGYIKRYGEEEGIRKYNEISKRHSKMMIGRKGISRYGKDNPFYGKTHTDELKEKVSKRFKGNTYATKRKGRTESIETRRKQSEARMGMKFTDEHRMNLSVSVSKGLTGRKLSEEHKRNISIGIRKSRQQKMADRVI